MLVLRGSYRHQGRLVTYIEDAREANLLIGASYRHQALNGLAITLSKRLCQAISKPHGPESTADRPNARLDVARITDANQDEQD